MRNTLWIAVITLGFAVTACKEDKGVDLDIEDQRDRVNTQRADYPRDKDVDVDVNVDKDTDDDWARAKADMRARIDRIDARLDELAARTDEESKQAAERLRARRDQMAADLERTEDSAQGNWEEFKASVKRGVDEIEAELDAAFD
jgi:hypothetical protein